MPGNEQMNMTLAQLRSMVDRGRRPEVEMTTNRASVLLIYLHDDDTAYQLVDEHQKPICRHSVEEVKDLLRPLGFTHGTLTFLDASDEMVGSEMGCVDIKDLFANGTRVGF